VKSLAGRHRSSHGSAGTPQFDEGGRLPPCSENVGQKVIVGLAWLVTGSTPIR
jgi:hypothetical protein